MTIHEDSAREAKQSTQQPAVNEDNQVNQRADQHSTTQRKLSRRTMLKSAAFFGLSLPLALAACAPVPTAPSATTTEATPEAEVTATGEAASPTTENTLIRLVTSSGGITLFAETRGAFVETLKSKGIDVEWVGPLGAHAPALQAVTGGSADLTFGGSSTVAMAGILAGSPYVFTGLLSSQPRTTAIVATAESGITSVPELKGKKVAANRSGLGEFILIAALEKYGLTRDDVEIAYLNPPDAAPAFAQGQIDAWSIFGGNREIAEVEYGGTAIFIEGEELSEEEQIDVQSFIALRESVEAAPEVYRAVIEGYQAEAEWANTNVEDALALQAERAGWSPAVAEKYATYNTQYTISFINDTLVANLQRASEWLLAHEVLPEPITIADHVVYLDETAA